MLLVCYHALIHFNNCFKLKKEELDKRRRQEEEEELQRRKAIQREKVRE